MFRLVLWSAVAVAWLRCAAAVMGGDPAAPPEPDAAVVFIQKHGRSARLEGIKDDKFGYYSFIGIRYAEPPVGARRFRRATRRWVSGDVAAAKHCMPCPQPASNSSDQVIGDEDCLCINVYAPKLPGDEQGCPVIFFIHGGNYRRGSTAYYGGKHLTQKDTILVTAQYRLGSLGFLSTGQRDASGNLGLFDLRAAMTWINDYIEFFGGDPKRIVVMGQGSGGSASSLMALSRENNVAVGVIGLSGAPLSPGAVRNNSQQHARDLALNTGCPPKPAEALLNCLRKLPAANIVKADNKLHSSMVNTRAFLDEISGRSGAGTRVEGEEDRRGLPLLVSESPTESLSKKNKLFPLLTGVTSAETSRAVFGKYSKFLTEKLQELRNFIKDEVVSGLQDVLKDVGGLLPKVISNSPLPLSLEDYYQGLFENSLRAGDGLAQIVEATGDALFNFPAYMSVQKWRSGGPAYLYSFEHVGNLSKGTHFLPSHELTVQSNELESSRKVKGPAHGDELAYIFEPLDENGQSFVEDVSSEDAKIRNSFVGLIADFAHSIGVKQNNKSTLFGFDQFLIDTEKFIKINSNGIETDKNFRFCQMSLWGNMGERLTGALCKNLLSNILKPKLPKLPVNLPSQQVQPLGNILGAPASPKNTKQQQNKKENVNLLPFKLG